MTRRQAGWAHAASNRNAQSERTCCTPLSRLRLLAKAAGSALCRTPACSLPKSVLRGARRVSGAQAANPVLAGRRTQQRLRAATRRHAPQLAQRRGGRQHRGLGGVDAGAEGRVGEQALQHRVDVARRAEVRKPRRLRQVLRSGQRMSRRVARGVRRPRCAAAAAVCAFRIGVSVSPLSVASAAGTRAHSPPSRWPPGGGARRHRQFGASRVRRQPPARHGVAASSAASAAALSRVAPEAAALSARERAALTSSSGSALAAWAAPRRGGGAGASRFIAPARAAPQPARARGGGAARHARRSAAGETSAERRGTGGRKPYVVRSRLPQRLALQAPWRRLTRGKLWTWRR